MIGIGGTQHASDTNQAYNISTPIAVSYTFDTNRRLTTLPNMNVSAYNTFLTQIAGLQHTSGTNHTFLSHF